MKIVTSTERLAAMLAHDPYAVTREPFPAPVRTSRDLGAQIMSPDSVLRLAEYARELHWEVRTQFACGHYPHATTGRPGALKDTVALRFGAHPLTERQAFAIYVRTHRPAGTWSWDSIMVWGPDLVPFAGCGLTELKAYLALAPVSSAETLALWVEERALVLREAGEARARRAREVPAARPVREGMR